MNDNGKSGEESGWLRKALSVLGSLPRRHRPAAFVAVLLSGIAVTVAATLVAKDGISFLYGAPVVAFGSFFVATIALLFYLKPGNSGGLVGLFYFLPLLYAVVVLSLAFLSTSEEAGALSLTRPSNGATAHSPLSVEWEPPLPALVTVARGNRTLYASERFVQPPHDVAVPPGQDMRVKIQTRHGSSVQAIVDVTRNPGSVALESVYRPDIPGVEPGLELGLTIPLGHAIDAYLVVEGEARHRVDIFGKAERCENRVKSPGGVRDLCYFFLPVIPMEPGIVTARVRGTVYDSAGTARSIDIDRSARFGAVLVSLDLDIDFDGTARLVEVPG